MASLSEADDVSIAGVVSALRLRRVMAISSRLQRGHPRTTATPPRRDAGRVSLEVRRVSPRLRHQCVPCERSPVECRVAQKAIWLPGQAVERAKVAHCRLWRRLLIGSLITLR